MRAAKLILLLTLGGCSAEVVRTPPVGDSGSPDVANDAPAIDAPTVDARADVRPVDVVLDLSRPDVACPVVGQTRCGDLCASLDSDRNNCGACGHACCAGELCFFGRCTIECVAGQTSCGSPGNPCAGRCINLMVDSGNCRTCGHACGSGEACIMGECQCQTPWQLCGGVCVGVLTDANNCGSCGTACLAGQRCNAGSCLACAGCSAGTTCCGARCVDLQTDNANCGACGRQCPASVPCSLGACFECLPAHIVCAGSCVDPMFDSANCGGCGQPCCAGNACNRGVCAPGCSAGMTACPGSLSSCRGGVCADLTTDATNCGSCGNRCAAGAVCVGGACRGGFMALPPCDAASNYVSATTITFGGAVGLAYSPRCLTVHAGATVTWTGDFSGHPLTPSTRGSTMNPIPSTSAGGSVGVRFATAGFYPFYCGFHGSDAGDGMSGVVQVVE